MARSRKSSRKAATGVQRISVSLPGDVCEALERLRRERGFENRSQAVAELVRERLAEHRQRIGDEVMAGTMTLVYDESKGAVLRDLARISREYVNEVISSHHVLLEDSHVLEVLLMQGPASTLRTICDRLVGCKGVKLGRLTLTPNLLPPLHNRATA
jgi:CopG family nickel-responsive transcriptional regulator